MNRLFYVCMGFGLCLCVVFGCATAFPWRYYNMEMPTECYDEGKLLGKAGSDGWADLSLETCKPDPDPVPGASPSPKPVKMKCATLKLEDFYALKGDDEKCHNDLNACQHQIESLGGVVEMPMGSIR